MKTSLMGLVDKVRDKVGGGRRNGGPPELPPVTTEDVLAYVEDERTRPYQAGPVTPFAQMATRVLLWGGVGVGFLGGVIGFVAIGMASRESEPVVVFDDVPMSVAGVAELSVEAWLTGEDKQGDEEAVGRWEGLFVEDVNLGLRLYEDLRILGVTAVGGERVHDGYWAVMVAADVLPRREEPGFGPEDEGDGDGDDDEEMPAPPVVETWYLEVGVVGNAGGGLSPVRAPALMPAPAGAGSGWQVAGPRPEVPEPDDPLAEVVEGFLAAVLTGQGEPDRYLVPGLDITAVRPVPFQTLSLEAMSLEAVDVDDDDDDDVDHLRVQAHVRVTTWGGQSRDAAYQVLVERRANRWEVADMWGAPTLGGVGG